MSQNNLLTNMEIAGFCSQTALILKAGISPVEGLEIMKSDIKNKEGQEIIGIILESCRKGESFTNALGNSGYFPDYVIDMVRIGEESGRLDSVMISLSDYYNREENTNESIKNALLYPFSMILMMLVVIYVLISKVLPIFDQVFKQLGSEMNSFSKGLLNIGDVMNRFSIFFVILLAVIALVALFFTKTKRGKLLSHKLFQTSFLTKNFSSQIAAGRFADGLTLTLESGLDTFKSLEMVAKMVDHPAISKKILNCKSLLMSGMNFAEALNETDIFSNLQIRMIGIAFKTGNLTEVMNQIADQYEKESERKIQSVISIIEPSLVILLSVIVGMILLSVILPLMGIMSSIG